MHVLASWYANCCSEMLLCLPVVSLGNTLITTVCARKGSELRRASLDLLKSKSPLMQLYGNRAVRKDLAQFLVVGWLEKPTMFQEHCVQSQVLKLMLPQAKARCLQLLLSQTLRNRSIETHLSLAGAWPWVHCQCTQDYKYSHVLCFRYANTAPVLGNGRLHFSLTLK